MKTKLVYVLTCVPEATYIEQALISIWSARYHNPDAHIVLLVDDLTDQLLIGKRAEVLENVTEKVVVPFEDANVNMMYRSRWIKTQVRDFVKGDLLFIDCDTIVNHSLEELDALQCEVCAVCESNLPIAEFCEALYKPMADTAQQVGWNIEEETYYFSSGVIYAKDCAVARDLFAKWHDNWLDSTTKEINIDQPSLAKANIECGHVIERIDDKWNYIMFTYPRLAKNAYILHYAAYRNMSFLFSKRVLKYIREYGLTEYLRSYIIDSTASYIPFNSEFYHYRLKDYRHRFCILYKGIRDYAEHIDATFEDYSPKNVVYKLLRNKCYRLATIVLLLLSYRRVRLNQNYKFTENICSK